MSFWRDPEHGKDKGEGKPRWLERGARYDRLWAIAVHRRAANPFILGVMLLTSRLGDGLLWYAIMIALPVLDSQKGFSCLLQMQIGRASCRERV